MLSVSRQRKTIKHLRSSHFLLSIVHLFNKYLTELGFPDGSDNKDLPAMQETRVLSTGGEDPLEKEIAIHSSVLA